ncbi:MAG TPA: hypothetical protein VE957_08130 [Terriglobales bacterium]|nr:hypothetical protein [Terriglobales bacterium]
MTVTAQQTFNALMDGFCAEQGVCTQDLAILEHALDGWSMGGLARHLGTTAGALHSRKRQLLGQMREFLERRGIHASTDIFEPLVELGTAHRRHRNRN